MKITSHVQKFDAKRYMDFFYKTFIDGGLVHLWFTANEQSFSYEPEFSIKYWDHVASWPIEMPFEEGVVPYLIVEWLEWCRPHGLPLDIDKIAELSLEHLMDVAKQENKEWDRMKAWKEKRRAEELADVLTA